jgi:glyoxylase-like metal-dependent hydrolase (beta-lactamase superfamily II)
MPQETIAMREYIESNLSSPVKYVINTHHHADHCWGNCFFPNATIIGHKICRDLMLEKSNSALAEANKENALFKNIRIIPPQITFDEGSLTLRVGKKQLRLFSTPGHSADGISILVEEDRILFAGDAFMPIPFIVGGDINVLTDTIRLISKMSLENIIQGHGDIILRGEVEEAARSNIAYLRAIKKITKASLRRRNPLEILSQSDVESCGKSRVSLGGLANELHQKNLRSLYNLLVKGEEI